MISLHFEWDPAKDRENRQKHGISFKEAQSVFWDERGRLIHDPDHSEEEDRFILMGISDRLRVLVVCHAYREDDSTVRIISARKASRNERRQYEEP
jgi:uncharacterized protein